MKNLYQSLLIILLGSWPGWAFGQVPVMSSNPSAAATIFLDFDGHLVQGTSWNWNGAIACAPSNLPEEKITEIFHRVAEDYRPFQVNVTTDSTKYWAAPATSRTRLILTVTSSWYGSAGGVAYMNSFSWGDNTPAFVFTALLNYNTKNIAEAASHEVGHTLGLRHQSAYDANCNKTSEYNTGTGTGEIGWAPIMGVGYYRNFTLWNSGANPLGCTNIQNDLEIITGNNGFSYRPDDYGTQFQNAAVASFNNNQFLVEGIIERNTDIDIIKFTIPSFGLFKLDALPYNVGEGNTGSNLDLQVELMTGQNTVIRTYNPADLLHVAMDTLLNPGNYWLRIQGKGNAYASAYASLGSYKLSGSFTYGALLPVHKFELKGQRVNEWHKLSWEIVADEQVVKQTIEVSYNGAPFEPVAHPANDERTFSLLPAKGGTVLYRIRNQFDDGKTYYSNVISLKSEKEHRPALMSTLVSAGIVVNSPSGFNYHIIDMGGRIHQQGKLINGINQLSSAQLQPGMYFIRYSDGSQVFSEKFMKQ